MKKTYFYLFSLEHFKANIPNEKILKIYKSGQYPEGCPSIQKYSAKQFAELINNDMLDDQNYWVRAIDERRPCPLKGIISRIFRKKR